MWRQISYGARVRALRPSRYRELLAAVHARRPRTIVEIGAHNGRNACRMIETAAIFTDPSQIHYHGFDLFELLTEDELVKEFSLRPPTRAEVQRRLEKTGANIHLHQGYSRDTLKAWRGGGNGHGAPQVDFLFIDGGHSIETVASDWADLLPTITPDTTVVLDDYYPGDEPQLKELGCRPLIESLDRSQFEVEVLKAEDRFPKDWGVLRVRMVRVGRRAPASPAAAAK
jgi:hypothetical protein